MPTFLLKSFFEHIYIHLTIEPESEVPVVSKSGEIKKVKFSETDVSLAKRLLELNENKALPSYEPKTYNSYYDKNRIVRPLKKECSCTPQEFRKLHPLFRQKVFFRIGPVEFIYAFRA